MNKKFLKSIAALFAVVVLGISCQENPNSPATPGSSIPSVITENHFKTVANSFNNFVAGFAVNNNAVVEGADGKITITMTPASFDAKNKLVAAEEKLDRNSFNAVKTALASIGITISGSKFDDVTGQGTDTLVATINKGITVATGSSITVDSFENRLTTIEFKFVASANTWIQEITKSDLEVAIRRLTFTAVSGKDYVIKNGTRDENNNFENVSITTKTVSVNVKKGSDSTISFAAVRGAANPATGLYATFEGLVVAGATHNAAAQLGSANKPTRAPNDPLSLEVTFTPSTGYKFVASNTDVVLESDGKVKITFKFAPDANWDN